MPVSHVGEECAQDVFWHWKYSPVTLRYLPLLEVAGESVLRADASGVIEARAPRVSHSVDNEMHLPQWGTPAEPGRSDRIESAAGD